MTVDSQWDSTYTWRIENYLSRSQNVDDYQESPDFNVRSLSGRKWRLGIYPRAKTVFADQKLSLYLYHFREKEADKECFIDYEVSLMNVNEDILESKITKGKFIKDTENRGLVSFVKFDQVETELKKCSEDTLIVRCRIKNKDVSNKMKTEKYNLKWPIKVFSNDILTPAKHFFCLDNVLFEISISQGNDEIFINVRNVTKSVLPSHAITGKISLLDVKGKETLSTTKTYTFDLKTENDTWKIILMTKTKLQNTFDSYVINGDIVLLCEFTINCEGIVTSNVSNPNSETVSNIEGLVSLSCDLRSLLSNKSNSDVKLSVQGEKELLAHRSILAVRSPVFSAMFDNEMIEKRTGIVDIEDMESKTLESFLEFLYTGMVDNMDYEKATKLLVVAEKYQVSSLKGVCAKFLVSSFSVKNVCEILLLANMVSEEHLKITSFDYISVHAVEILPSMEWLELVEKNAKLFQEVNAYIVNNCTITPRFA